MHVDTRGNPARDRPRRPAAGQEDPRPQGRDHLRPGRPQARPVPRAGPGRGAGRRPGPGGPRRRNGRLLRRHFGAGRAGLASWAAAFPSVTVWADVDAAGIKAARELRAALARLGRELSIKALPQGLKDPAAAAATSPLPLLDVALVRELTAELEAADGLPRWEAARIAALTTA